MKKDKNSTCRRGSKGFTLIELIIVIAIMAVLAGAIVPSVIKYIKKARAGRATEEARIIVTAVQNGLATNCAEDSPLVINKSFKQSDGSTIPCGVITNWMLSKAQSGDVVADTDLDYTDYLISMEILKNLNASEGNEYKFFKFNGNARNPIGVNCESFASSYNCPGVIVVYNSSGYVVLLEYYNYGCLIHYEDGEYSVSESETFVGSSKIVY